MLAQLITYVSSRAVDERNLAAKDLVQHPAMTLFGLGDSAIAALAASPHLVITDDDPLCSYLEGNGLPALRFSYLRGS